MGNCVLTHSATEDWVLPFSLQFIQNRRKYLIKNKVRHRLSKDCNNINEKSREASLYDIICQ